MPAMRTVMMLSLLILVGGAAAAQDRVEFQVAVPAAADPTARGTLVYGAGTRADMGLLSVEPFESGRPVLDAPYTADSSTEVTQMLADGNRIGHKSTGTIARDGRGRVRREHQAMFLGPVVAQRDVPLVTITDPSTGVHITLDTERRTAFVMKGGVPAIAAGRGFGLTVRTEAITSSATMASSAKSDVRTEQLGERSIEGVRGEGTLTTVTIPAGAIGNELPIEVVSERWYSPELQVVLMTRRSDPRFGETVYRLTNIVRVEPSTDLFEVPQGYRVEEPGRMVRPRKR